LGKFVVLSVGEKFVDLLGRQVAPLVLFNAAIVHPPVPPDIPDNMDGIIEPLSITPPSALDNTIWDGPVAADWP
jgi:hypothetical protein